MNANLRTAAERAMHRELVDLFAAVLGLAVERHGDVIRTALGQVFNLESVESSQRTIGSQIQSQFESITRIRHDIHELETKLKRLVNRVEDIDLHLDAKESVPF
jgi:hypothetical protein